ncbi:MAG: hypothetical protein DSY77_02985 [Bacteroidetes bacterium]|nr:MAG: hypothetical protein DSY77_02985 [Bacteroidota bacterium]
MLKMNMRTEHLKKYLKYRKISAFSNWGAYYISLSLPVIMKQILTMAFLLFCSLTFAQVNGNKISVTKTKQVDTIYNTDRVEIVNKSFDKLVANLTKKDSETNSMWATLIPLLIGSGLTLLTTFFIEQWKTGKEKEVKKQQLVSRGRAKTYLLTQVLKDLAMYKVHKQYYLRASQLEQNSEKEDSFKKHYEKGQEQRITEAKFDDNIAEYFELVTEYSILTKKVDYFQKHFQDIFNFEHPKSSNFANIDSLSELVDGLNNEEKRLNDKYKKLTAILEQIQIAMN